MNAKHAVTQITTALISIAPVAGNFTHRTTDTVHAVEDRFFYTVEVQFK